MTARVLGDYNVIKQIGQGSLGTVLLAEHRFMKKQCVLKVLPEELATDRSFIQRFEDEVKILSLLDHPNIVKIHNVSFAQGLYFLVTDCIVDTIGETTNLAQYMAGQSSRLSEEELMRCLRQVANALDYAHSRQLAGHSVVHRGLKLNNILVGNGKSGVEFYLSDFGLSRIVGAGAVLSRTYKVLAEALGVSVAVPPANKGGQEKYPSALGEGGKLSMLHNSFLQNYLFLAPEQKRLEESAIVDAKADVYAFGVLAYFLIAGSCPEGLFELPSEIAPEYYFDWDHLVLQCLHVKPEKRALALEDLLDKISSRKGGNTKQEDFPFSQATVRSLDLPDSSLDNAQKRVETLPSQGMVAKTESVEELSEADQKQFSVGEKIEQRIRSELIVTQYRPEIREASSVEPLGTEAVFIPEGKFFRGSAHGSRDEMPKHAIHLPSFAIDIHPVTNEQFIRFLEAVGGEKDHQNHDIIRLRDSRIRRSAGKLTIESGYAKHPVVGVSWYGALAYAKWVGKRLPTEAEWEVAAYGGIESGIYPTGEDIEKFQANFFSSDTTAVMSYAPNGYGLYDMSGNVYEWCQDWYDYNYYEHSAQEPESPKGPLQGVYRVLRGGCWKSLKEDLRCSHRHRNNPGTVNRTYGFRCALDC